MATGPRSRATAHTKRCQGEQPPYVCTPGVAGLGRGWHRGPKTIPSPHILAAFLAQYSGPPWAVLFSTGRDLPLDGGRGSALVGIDVSPPLSEPTFVARPVAGGQTLHELTSLPPFPVGGSHMISGIDHQPRVPRPLAALAPRLSWGETHTGLDGV